MMIQLKVTFMSINTREMKVKLKVKVRVILISVIIPIRKRGYRHLSMIQSLIFELILFSLSLLWNF